MNIETNSQLDPEMLAGIVPGCWVQDKWSESGRWYLVCSAPYQSACSYKAGGCWHCPYCQVKCVRAIIPDATHTLAVEIEAITVLHEPCREPRMETAYKLGESDEVTREQAEKMVASSQEWEWLDEDADGAFWRNDWAAGLIESGIPKAIRSPDGNVYRVKEKP